MTHQRISVGGLPLPGTTHVSLGANHPSEVGVIGIDVVIDDGLISAADVRPGYLHRGAEKLFEVRDYRSLIMLADRHDWLASFSGELVVTLAVESAMGLVPPPRATRLRTILAEYARVHSHLSYLSYLLPEGSAGSVALWRAVERLRTGLASWSGNRVHPMLCRVGGLATDAPEGWLAELPVTLDAVARVAASLDAALEASADRFHGLAVVDGNLCRGHGLSGPVARSCGLDLDRRAAGGLDYAGFFRPAPLQEAGDAHARFRVLIDELGTSADMLRGLAADVPAGEVATRLSRRLKVPEGDHVIEVEAPWGIAGVLLVSRGGPTPWRLSLRTPTFANVSALGSLLVGCRPDQVADVIASLGYGIGDLDK